MSFEQIFKATVATFWIMLWMTAWMILTLKIKPLKVERLPRRPRPDYLSKDIVERILKEAEVKKDEIQPESCDWLNLILKWWYAELAPLPKFRTALDTFFEDMVLNFRRSRSLGSYITGTKLIDVQMGTKSPSLSKARVILTPTDDLPLTALCTDLKYSGGILGVAKLEMIGGWQLFMRCRLCELSGPLYIVVKDTDLFYGFGKIDDIKIRCQMVINGVQFGWLNWIVSRLVLPQFIRTKMVFPAMKAKYLVTPQELERLRASIL